MGKNRTIKIIKARARNLADYLISKGIDKSRKNQLQGWPGLVEKVMLRLTNRKNRKGWSLMIRQIGSPK